MPTHHPGRHELGQNFLVHTPTVASFVDAVRSTEGPIIEIGAGLGALTLPLADLGRPVTAIEIDRRAAKALRRSAPSLVTVETADFLTYRLPRHRHVLVGNLPFHLTTALLRRILRAPAWTDAVLLVQWEVARRRAGVGGATLMTAQWWPWYTFALLDRVPARAFRPVPNVDGGLLTITRRPTALEDDRSSYQRFVQQVFTGRGRGLADTVARTTPGLTRHKMTAWMRDHGIRADVRPKDLTATDWVGLYALHRS
jgi:23S rRNA (adenine-N6)-dimethyltransferase